MKYIFIVGFISLSLLAQDPDPPPLTSEQLVVADIFTITLTLINYRQPSRGNRGEIGDEIEVTDYSPVEVLPLPHPFLFLSASAMPLSSAPAAGDWIL